MEVLRLSISNLMALIHRVIYDSDPIMSRAVQIVRMIIDNPHVGRPKLLKRRGIRGWPKLVVFMDSLTKTKKHIKYAQVSISMYQFSSTEDIREFRSLRDLWQQYIRVLYLTQLLFIGGNPG